MSDFPTEDMELTHLLVVTDMARARSFYRDVLGAELYRDYGGTSVVFRFLGTWLLLVTGGEPTADKPDVVFSPPEPQNVSHEMTVRVPDCRAATRPSAPEAPNSSHRRSNTTGKSAASSAIPTAISSRSARRRRHELDLMARMVGLGLKERRAGWNRGPFSAGGP